MRVLVIEAELQERLQDVGIPLATNEIAKVLATTEAALDAAEQGAAQAQQDHAQTLSVLSDAREVLIDHVCKLPLSKRDHGPILYRIDAELRSSAALAALTTEAAEPLTPESVVRGETP